MAGGLQRDERVPLVARWHEKECRSLERAREGRAPQRSVPPHAVGDAELDRKVSERALLGPAPHNFEIDVTS
jgi:hypothetical protein